VPVRSSSSGVAVRPARPSPTGVCLALAAADVAPVEGKARGVRRHQEARVPQKDGAVEIVYEVGHRIAHMFKEAERHATEMVNYWKSNGLTLPEIGKAHSQDTHFSLAIKLFKGQEPDFKKFVVNHHRDEFHTRPLFFGFDTDA
jgi:hypothetical protein